METKIIEAKKVLFVSLKTSLSTIGEQSSPLAYGIMKEIESHGITPVGPMEYIYIGASGDLDNIFDLDIAIPVSDSEANQKSQYETRNLEDYKCMSYTHKGSLDGLAQVYNDLFEKINKSGAKPTNEVREVYQVWEGPTSEKNVVEIQIGLN